MLVLQLLGIIISLHFSKQNARIVWPSVFFAIIIFAACKHFCLDVNSKVEVVIKSEEAEEFELGLYIVMIRYRVNITIPFQFHRYIS